MDVARAAGPGEEKAGGRGASITVPQGSRLGMLSQASRYAQQTGDAFGLWSLHHAETTRWPRLRELSSNFVSSLTLCYCCRFMPQRRGSHERRRTREAELGQDRTPHAFAAHLHSSAASVFDRKLAPPSYAHTTASLNGGRLLNVYPRSWVSRRPALNQVCGVLD